MRPKNYPISRHSLDWRRALFWEHTHSDSFGESIQLLPEVKTQGRLPSIFGRPRLQFALDCCQVVSHLSGPELFLPWIHRRRRWLLRVPLVWVTPWWNSREGLGQWVCGGTVQVGVLILRERAGAAGTAFHEEASWCASHPVLLCLSHWISCSPPEPVPLEYLS